MDINGPIKIANIIVPIPTVPPKSHPNITTVVSIINLTKLIGLLKFSETPFINPSLVPGPKFVVKYKPLPSPTKNIPKKRYKIEIKNEEVSGIK